MSLTLPSPRSLHISLPRLPRLGRSTSSVKPVAETVWEPVVCATVGCPRRDQEAFETSADCPGCGKPRTTGCTVVESPGWWR